MKKVDNFSKTDVITRNILNNLGCETATDLAKKLIQNAISRDDFLGKLNIHNTIFSPTSFALENEKI